MPRPSAATAAAAPPIAALLLLLLSLPSFTASIRPAPLSGGQYVEAPHFRNADHCPAAPGGGAAALCHPSTAHIAMTLDSSYLRGTVAAVHSLLKHSSCPSLLFFHFIVSGDTAAAIAELRRAFPSLPHKIHSFAPSRVAALISPSLRPALEAPLNYARSYLAGLLPRCVPRVLYLDSDVVATADVRHLLLNTPMDSSSSVIAAPEYCHANFTRYFTPTFWAAGGGAEFAARRRAPCYFNTGVMVVDLRRWRAGGYTAKIESWMRKQREEGIYELGSLPPFLLAFAGDVEAVEHRWNVHGLGGDNVNGSCRPLPPGPVSLLHWSGKGKPWDRLDGGVPCPVDQLWAPYDLYVPPDSSPPSAIASW